MRGDLAIAATWLLPVLGRRPGAVRCWPVVPAGGVGPVRFAAQIVAVAAVAVALVVAVAMTIDGWSAPPIVIEDPLVGSTIVVAVGGAVATPGVVALPAAARLDDALAAAGGPLPDADLASLNLARRLRDEEQIVVPRRAGGSDRSAGSAPLAASPASPAPPEAERPEVAPRLDLNRAAVEELDDLPGIGPALAGRIVDYRDANGPYRAVEELAAVDGISSRMVEALRPFVVVGG